MYDKLELYFKNFFKLPENPKKQDWMEVFIGMATHTRKRKPIETLLKRRPNEEPDIHQYRLDNWRAITYGSMNKALDDIYRILTGVSYTISAPDNVKEYLREVAVDEYTNIVQNEIINVDLFLKKITLKRDIEDPNGFLVWIPTGEGVDNSAAKVIPKPKLILSEQFYYSDSMVFIWKACEKSPLTRDKNIVLEGEIYYIFTKTEYWTMYQFGAADKPKWKQEILYVHNLNAFPVIVLGGEMNAEGFYESFFSSYLAFGDEAVHQFSDWQAIMCQSMHPIREEFMTECTFEKINLQSTNISDQEEPFQKNGNDAKYYLKAFPKSPYGTIQRKYEGNPTLNEVLPHEIPSVRYIAPPVETAKYSGESWEKLIEKAELALNIDLSVGVNQSGVAKQMDKESQYSMITKIGLNFFDNIMLNSLKIIEAYLNGTTIEKTTTIINKPSTFSVKNELDLIQEISTLKTNNAPSFILANATLELLKKRFNGNPVGEKMVDFVGDYDPYFIYTIPEKNQMLAAGVLTKEDCIRSNMMFQILQQIAREKTPDGFINMELPKIKEEFETKLEIYLPEEPIPVTGPDGNIV